MANVGLDLIIKQGCWGRGHSLVPHHLLEELPQPRLLRSTRMVMAPCGQPCMRSLNICLRTWLLAAFLPESGGLGRCSLPRARNRHALIFEKLTKQVGSSPVHAVGTDLLLTEVGVSAQDQAFCLGVL